MSHDARASEQPEQSGQSDQLEQLDQQEHAGGLPQLPGSEENTAPVASESLTAAAPAPASTVKWRRLHPVSPLLRGGLALLVIIGILIANLRDRVLELFVGEEILNSYGPDEGDLIELLVQDGLIIWAIVAVLLLLLLILFFSWLSWRFATFRITADAVEDRRGIIFRNHRRAPLDRIQSVNIQRSLLARIFGLSEVEVQTGGQGGAVKLAYLGVRDAKTVREQILLQAAQSKGERAVKAYPVASQDAAGVVHENALPVTAYVQADPSSAAPDQRGVSAAASALLERRMSEIVDPDIEQRALEQSLVIKVPVGRLLGSVLLGTAVSLVCIVLVLLVLAFVIGEAWVSIGLVAILFPLGLVLVAVTFSQFNRGFNFTLSRATDGVRIGAGLTATHTETIPFGRIHSVEARQSLYWRPFGWWQMRVTTAGNSLAEGGQNKIQNLLLPVGTRADVLKVFETLLHDSAEHREQRDMMITHGLLGDGSGFARAGKLAGWVLWLGTRRAGIRLDNLNQESASLMIRRGWVTRSLAVMPIARAQSVCFERPLLHRMLGLATIQAHTVLGPITMRMRGLDLGEARHIFDVLSDAVVMVQATETQRKLKARA